MEEIIVTTQEQLNAIEADFDGRVIIRFGMPDFRAVVSRSFRYSVVARGNVQVLDKTRTHNLTIFGNARIVYSPRNISEYIDFYGIESDGKTAKLFKAVHKCDGDYFSDYGNLEYRIGEIAVADSLDTNPSEDCGHGIHMAHKAWCLDYGRDWDDLAILEVEAEMSGIIVPEGNPGKVRAARIKVLREVPLAECGLMEKLMEKRRTATP